MKITVNEDQEIQIEEVFNQIVLQTGAKERMVITMRDSGFEFCYQGKWYFAKEGHVEPFHLSSRGNILVDQKHREDADAVCNAGINEKEIKGHLIVPSCYKCDPETASRTMAPAMKVDRKCESCGNEFN